jgi:nucleoside-diphosphate-sugar epimerase
VTAPRVLVTGSTGFLGKVVVSRLTAAGFQITELARRSKHLSVDLSHVESRIALSPWRWDVVINLAAVVPGKCSATATAWNIVATHTNIVLNLCSAIPAQWTGRLIHASSMAVYGAPERLPVDEKDPRRPTDAYGIAKCVAEDVINSAQAEKNFAAWILRLPGLFSEGRLDGALHNFVVNASRGLPLRIAAAQPTPWEVLHVEDAAEGIMRVLHSPAPSTGPMNLGYGEEMNLTGMAERIVRHFKSRSPIENVTDFTHPVSCLDIKKARALIDWPPATFDDRLDRFCDALSGAAAI